MKSKTVPRICDFCGKDIVSEKKYRLQISERTKKGDFKESTMVQCDHDADMCHACFIDMCSNGFEAKWLQLVKPDHGGKWITIEERAAKRADEKRNENETQELITSAST